MKRWLLVLPLSLAQAAPAPSKPAPAGATISGTVIVRKGGVVQQADAWVYLEDVTKHRRHTGDPGTGRREEIRQQGKQFVPHVVVVPTGAEVAFPNYDSEEHSVFSPTDPSGQWDLGRYSTNHKGKTHEFTVAGELDIYCDIHQAMWAKVKVVDTALIAQVIDHHYALANVPPGSYKVIAWTPNTKTRSASEVIVITDTTPVTVPELHPEAGEPAQHHRRINGAPYPIYP